MKQCLPFGLFHSTTTPTSVLESIPLIVSLLTKLNGAYHWPAQVG